MEFTICGTKYLKNEHPRPSQYVWYIWRIDYNIMVHNGYWKPIRNELKISELEKQYENTIREIKLKKILNLNEYSNEYKKLYNSR